MHELKKSGVVGASPCADNPNKPENRQSQYSTTVLQKQYQVALTWLFRGVPLVPLQPRSKCIVTGFGPHSEKITTEDAAWFWFHERQCNLALVTGAGLVVLDFDRREDYHAWRAVWPGLAKTYTELTRHGAHVFLAGESASGKLPGGVEVKGRGAVVMSSPSIHPSGFEYCPVDKDAAIIQVPAEFSLLSEPAQQKPPSKASYCPNNGSKDTLTKIKAAYPVFDLAQSLTRITSKDGRWWHGRCPFHDDKKPSFWVDVVRGLWGCYACNVRGDVVNLYALKHGLTVKDAVKAMAEGLQ